MKLENGGNLKERIDMSKTIRLMKNFTVTRRTRPDETFCESLLIPALSSDAAIKQFCVSRGSSVQRMQQLFVIIATETNILR